MTVEEKEKKGGYVEDDPTCNNCCGTGRVVSIVGARESREEVEKVCPTCNGDGRVKA